MGAKYIKEFPYIKEFFLEANEVLKFDILNLCLNSSEDDLNLTANAQPAILTLGYCAFQIIQKETEIKPVLMAGHSLGEISALCCSGAISFSDALKIVRKRGELMQSVVSSGDGTMMAINGLNMVKVQKLCDSIVPEGTSVVSNINSNNQIVISGLKNSVEAVGRMASELGAVIIPLKVSAPFHSPFMKPAALGLETELVNYSFSALKYPVISNVTCRPYMDENEIIPLLTKQVASAVNWQKIMEYIGKTCVDATFELPPKKTLTKLFKSHNSSITSYTFDQLEEIQNLLKVKIV
jgi:[acyl-carrier-protein] S-malonyltransferase